MVQREFAQRLIARPGDNMYSKMKSCLQLRYYREANFYQGRLSVNAQFHAVCSHIMKVLALVMFFVETFWDD
jgi:18S rRNA (adenine1779-N6/adenine1780-N6)-dimethyltransferase